MNSTATLPEIAEALAAAAGVDRDTATRFVVQLFSAVEAQLATTGKATLSGIGSFSNTARGIVFEPDPALAAAINAPFAIFAPMELSEEAARDFAHAEPAATTPELEPVAEILTTTAPEPEEEVLPPVYVPQLTLKEEPEAEEITDTKEENNEEHQEIEPDVADGDQDAEAVEEEEGEEGEEGDEEEEGEEEVEKEEQKPQPEPQIIYVARRNSWPWVVALIALVAGFAGGYCLGNYSGNVRETAPTVAEEVVSLPPAVADTDTVAYKAVADTMITTANTDSVAEPAAAAPTPAEPEKKEPVYDTVGTSRYLTTIARDHYGRKDYWVFIYEANSQRLKSPNLISPGTRVVIPDLGEHPALNPELRARSRKLAAEYAERYNL